MDFWGRATGISKFERVEHIMDGKRTTLQDIQEHQLKWFGHVQRMENHRLLKKKLNLQPLKSREQGKKKMTWKKGIQRAISQGHFRE